MYGIGLVAYALTLGLGLYLLNRGRGRRPVLVMGIGAVAYAFVIMCELLKPWLGLLEPLATLALATTAVCWVATLIAVWRSEMTRARPQFVAVLTVATVFFGLGLGLFVVPRETAGPPAWVWLAISVDVLVLGWAVARLDALELGEHPGRDLLRAALSALVAVGALAAPVIWGTRLLEAPSVNAVVTVAAVMTVSLAGLAFQPTWQRWLDRIVFARAPQLRQERAALQAVSAALPRLADEIDPAAVDKTEFHKLTRRALSQLNDLGRLASSPLTRLPVVTARVRARHATDDTLERARELRALLIERIERLRPLTAGTAGTGDEWRHYNALYFPYVMGLRPYAAGADHHGLPAEATQILAWLQTAVPERTLHNWQTSAARLIADDLRRA